MLSHSLDIFKTVVFYRCAYPSPHTHTHMHTHCSLFISIHTCALCAYPSHTHTHTHTHTHACAQAHTPTLTHTHTHTQTFWSPTVTTRLPRSYYGLHRAQRTRSEEHTSELQSHVHL